MQLHVNVENLMYDFAEFLNNDSCYLKMTNEKKE